MTTTTQFAKGRQFKTINFEPLIIQQWLGGGGQGDVYKVDFNGKPMALKWYKPNTIKNPIK